MSASPRAGRGLHELRTVRLETGAAPYAEGSCLVSFGSTRVLCAASVQENLPDWRKGARAGWVTAEYAMLPRATHKRTPRERGQVGGRTQEIQRLVGRALRACIDLEALGERHHRRCCCTAPGVHVAPGQRCRRTPPDERAGRSDQRGDRSR
jgi:ribonuclease PH